MAVRKKYASVLLAAAALLAPAARAETPAVWRGHTFQGYDARAVVSASGALVTSLRTRYALGCTDDSTVVRRLLLSRDNGDTLLVGTDGRFTTSGTVAGGLPQKGSGSLTYRVSGRVRSDRITGTLRVDYTLDSGVRCSTQLVGFVLR